MVKAKRRRPASLRANGPGTTPRQPSASQLLAQSPSGSTRATLVERTIISVVERYGWSGDPASSSGLSWPKGGGWAVGGGWIEADAGRDLCLGFRFRFDGFGPA